MIFVDLYYDWDEKELYGPFASVQAALRFAYQRRKDQGFNPYGRAELR